LGIGEPGKGRDGLRRVLSEGDLATKLHPLGGEPWEAGASESWERPARGPELAMGPGGSPLPRPGALVDPEARALCLARFAHHEIQAVELFAWALLRWPELPEGIRSGLASVLADEQRHARGYLERLNAHGHEFGDYAPHSDYFWKHAPAMQQPSQFFAAMGLTLEQANLDFTLLYRDAFREAGDETSAQLSQEVHDDEVGHVAFAARALEELESESDDILRYEAAVPFPLSAARAKGRRFDRAARQRAGLSDPFIEHIRVARSNQEQAGKNR